MRAVSRIQIGPLPLSRSPRKRTATPLPPPGSDRETRHEFPVTTKERTVAFSSFRQLLLSEESEGTDAAGGFGFLPTSVLVGIKITFLRLLSGATLVLGWTG